jgi:hypothetical protein
LRSLSHWADLPPGYRAARLTGTVLPPPVRTGQGEPAFRKHQLLRGFDRLLLLL